MPRSFKRGVYYDSSSGGGDGGDNSDLTPPAIADRYTAILSRSIKDIDQLSELLDIPMNGLGNDLRRRTALKVSECLKRLCEVLINSFLLANSIPLERRYPNLIKEQDVTVLIAALREVNPAYFPVPVSDLTGDYNHPKSLETESALSLSEDALIALLNKCVRVLEDGEALSITEAQRYFEMAFTLIERHNVQLPDPRRALFFMIDERESGKPHTFLMEKWPSSEPPPERLLVRAPVKTPEQIAEERRLLIESFGQSQKDDIDHAVEELLKDAAKETMRGDDRCQNFLGLIYTFAHPTFVVPAGSKLYRGRTFSPDEPLPTDISGFRYPPVHLAALQRCNLRGEQVMYACAGPKAPAYEIGVKAGTRYMIAAWEVIEPLTVSVVGFSEETLTALGALPEAIERNRTKAPLNERDQYLFNKLAAAFCMKPNDEEELFKHYRFTSSVFEVLTSDKLKQFGADAKQEIDALAYPSLLYGGNGQNFAIRRATVDKKMKLVAADFHICTAIREHNGQKDVLFSKQLKTIGKSGTEIIWFDVPDMDDPWLQLKIAATVGRADEFMRTKTFGERKALMKSILSQPEKNAETKSQDALQKDLGKGDEA